MERWKVSEPSASFRAAKSDFAEYSLRTDIPLKALNLHFGATYSIVSQVNPHINAFFFTSKGTVGRPVTHRRGRGWRGGYLGSATETYLKLELQKFLKMLRHLELLPRPLGQDWSGQCFQLLLAPFLGPLCLFKALRAHLSFRFLSFGLSKYYSLIQKKTS